jgi:MFS family permease
LALLFLCSFLDRTNVGNARILGLEEDIGITNQQYNIGLAVFYATYIASLVNTSGLMSTEAENIYSELPSNLVLKKISPKIWLPFLTFWWGVIAMCLGFVRNFGSFVAVRALLGAAEGGLLPGMASHIYQTTR